MVDEMNKATVKYHQGEEKQNDHEMRGIIIKADKNNISPSASKESFSRLSRSPWPGCHVGPGWPAQAQS